LQKASSKVVSIKAPLNSDQKAFATSLSKHSALSPRLAAAAVLREGGNLTPGDNNWLNIGAFDSGFDGGIMGDPRFRDPETAGKLTADFLKGKAYGASEGIQNINKVAKSGASDEQVGRAWANSGWASSGASPLDTLNQVSAKTKPIPKKLKTKAKAVLGKPAYKAIKKGGKVVKDPKAGEEKTVRFKGRYDGSQDVVRAIVGTKVKGDHGGTKHGEAPGVHSPTGDHYNPEGYAQDINGDNPSENEPPYNQDTLNTIVKNLRDLGGKDVPDLQIGENWEGTIDGYAVQVLTNEGGTVNHIHVGAHPVSEGGGSATIGDTNIPIKGSKLAVKMPTKTFSTPTATGTTATGTVASSVAGGTTTTSSKAKKKAQVRRRRSRSNYTNYADSAQGYYSIDPETYSADPFLKRLAELAQ
jgi:hypothetical protein